METSRYDHFDIQIIEKSIVKATNITPDDPPQLIFLSNLDLLSGRFPVTYFYVYPTSPHSGCFSLIIQSLKESLADTLNYFYPFAGRIVTNPKTDEPEIICDNSGCLVIEAHANIPLASLDFYNLDKSLQGKLVSMNHEFPLQVQVTVYTCDSISITFTFDHALGDASAFGNFLRSWSQIARGKPILDVPMLKRNKFITPRFPPSYSKYLDDVFISCSIKDILDIPANDISVKRLYHIDAKDIDRLQRLASAEGVKRTKIEAFSAYIWKLMATTVSEANTNCKMGWLVDGRTRMFPQTNSMSNYIGNVLSVAIGDASLIDLKQRSLSDVGETVHGAISKVTNESHFLDLIDWVECHRPGLMLAKIVLGKAGPCLVLSSAGRFPVAELDFGFGAPILGTVCSTINKIGTGYMNQRPSARGDGSWVVSAIVWPALALALESDPNTVFQPMTTYHLGL
ncbi:Anthranilate n-benzoyltransferase protein [Thalictrum thalictroides]|uniref:Anthranilate n-benzoyltransferase protein n=1 Tax=Thalictrum thalictroides TaxID=46969 RepID=A0A7J6WH22_THATH|nr:Anthranilate n-benzoyltransferase protein [Thalictrum thalictroides]